MNPNLEQLHPYPFEKLATLFADLPDTSQYSPVALSIGEPQHPAPAFVRQALADNLDRLSHYPSTRGDTQLRECIASWLRNHFGLKEVRAESQVLPVNGTREALFAFAQAMLAPGPEATVLCPNPFYQIYEGAALLASATPEFIDCRAQQHFVPDFSQVSPAQWQRCQLLYLCTPGNPTGAVLPLSVLKELIELAHRYDFTIASDECYSEIYPDETAAPPGLLEASEALGNDTFSRCVVFHSLSKRSNLPGLRSGFVAGDEQLLARFLRYRTYHGCAMPPHHQAASIAAWGDEQHVQENRQLYRNKFAAVLDILGDSLEVQQPDAGFYLWPRTPIADTEFARILKRDYNVTVLPGRYLARDAGLGNPGENRIRLALVASQQDCEEAAQRIVRCVEQLNA